MEKRKSLCDRCENYWSDFTNEVIIPALKDAGMDFSSIWCGVSNRPENKRWKECEFFKERNYGQEHGK